jgi:hypothetical protein
MAEPAAPGLTQTIERQVMGSASALAETKRTANKKNVETFLVIFWTKLIKIKLRF